MTQARPGKIYLYYHYFILSSLLSTYTIPDSIVTIFYTAVLLAWLLSDLSHLHRGVAWPSTTSDLTLSIPLTNIYLRKYMQSAPIFEISNYGLRRVQTCPLMGKEDIQEQVLSGQ